MKKKTKLAFALCIACITISCKQSEATEAASDAKSETAPISKDEADASESPNGETRQEDPIASGQITAGEWNDLNNWSFWKSLNETSEFSEMDTYWNYNLENRISVNAKSNAKNLIDVPVLLLDSENNVVWQSKTNNKGNAELWPFMKNNNQSTTKNLKIKIGNQLFENIKYNTNHTINQLNVTENSRGNTRKKIDIAFMVDATGSMGDEIDYLKAELTDVIAKVKSNNANAIVNMGSVFYRDHGDDYVTKKSDFSTDCNETIDFIKDQSANGGGDFPEAVDEALSESIEELNWSDDATSRILFLVLDAPPHYENQKVAEIHKLIALASKKGIKIIPITASGIDKETEFLMRYMAIATNGTYVFITNDSGIGNDHLVASVGQYQVELLNKMIERLVNESLE